MGKGINKRIFDLLINGFKFQKVMAKSTRLPFMMKLLQRNLNSKTMNLTYIPINKDIDVPPGISAPLSIVEHFINKASYHVILKKCPCRSVLKCEKHDQSFGCTFIGEGAREVSRELGYHVSRDEALQHLYDAANAGLITLIGKFEADAIALGVKQKSKFMTICHCCDCCCVSKSVRFAAKPARDLIVKLEGIETEVTDSCTGCGNCISACVFHQISINREKAVIGKECKGCGRCADACPNGAIAVRVTDSSYIEAYAERIGSKVKVD